MGVLFIFLFVSVLVISALLFFNKGEKALEIKRILKDIYENLKELISNLKKLFLILKELIQSILGNETTKEEDTSSSEDSLKQPFPGQSASKAANSEENPSGAPEESESKDEETNTVPEILSSNQSEVTSQAPEESESKDEETNTVPEILSSNQSEVIFKNSRSEDQEDSNKIS